MAVASRHQVVPERVGSCNVSSNDCLIRLAFSIPIWDSASRAYVTATPAQFPSSFGQRLTGEGNIAAAQGVLAALARMANGKTARPHEDRARGNAEQVVALQRQLAYASTSAATAETRRQYSLRVLAPRTRAHAYRGCLGPGKCDDETGPCEWCGASLCCRAGAAGDSELCGGAGGKWRHVCTPSPAGWTSATATLDALHAFARPSRRPSKTAPVEHAPPVAAHTLPPQFRLVTGG